jgi:hypothetical protein
LVQRLLEGFARGVGDGFGSPGDDEAAFGDRRPYGEVVAIAPAGRRREHRPAEADADHLAQDLGLVRLGDDVERRADAAQSVLDHQAGVAAGGECHPRSPLVGRTVEGAEVGGVDEVPFAGERRGHDPGDEARRLDADDEVELGPAEPF